MDFTNDTPIYIQIMDKIKSDIITGKLKKGDKLMSTRELAVALKVNPNTVQRVFKELESEEICFTKRGMGTFVTEDDQTLALLKTQIAKEKIAQFVEGMKSLNMGFEEIINKLKAYEEGKL
ncbi:GntR family transcriptional regulator [Fusibacter bizertensis]|uniref:GntR family transcriptional regulator n=1 Tax=Fusibacter bizertensis TaxID=1488331 RepID=A0ABT6N8N1_9FIRM|nr:GntR family transcriptional regulator [Fusibacter bizertensis]MDH8676763.1 GntR family transcriptional regulator [Fusibacter bizertensis]